MFAAKQFFNFFSFSVVLFLTVACGKKQDAAIDVSAAQITPANLTKENDERFLVRAAEMKYEQILLGKLAKGRSSVEEVKQLALLLEEANRAQKSELASLGIVKTIKVPAAPTASAHQAYDTLNTAGIEGFDTKYLTFVIQGYQQAISHFESAGSGSIDVDIKAKAVAMLPEMRQHLTMAKEVEAILHNTTNATAGAMP